MEIEIIWVEGKDELGNPTWTWTISGRKSYEITKLGYRGYDYQLRLLRDYLRDYYLRDYYLDHPTLDKAKDYAVKHFLATNPEMTLSEGGTKIVSHAKSEQLTQPGQNQTEFPGPEKQKQVDPERKMKYVDDLETEPAASPGVPQKEQAESPNHRRMTRSPSPSTSLHGGNATVISQFESSLSLNEANTTENPMITHRMLIVEVLDLLGEHGCKDLTDQLDTSNFSERPMSSGGYGDVYRGAFHDRTAVAVKCLRLHEDSSEATKKQLKRAARELYVWSKCDHPNVLGLIGVAQYRGQIAMVSPWMERGSLKRLLLQQAEVDRYTMCAQITDGVAYMHSKNMVHGDLKCDNILVSSDLTPKLTDFGNASLKEYTLQFTNTTSSVGVSLNWAAPEMLDEEQNNPTMESDVYSLGMTILETITGEAPYTGISQQRIYVKKVVKKVLPTRPEAYLPLHSRHANLLWSLVENCCAFTPEDRPNAGEVQERMKEVMMARGSGNLS